MALKQDLYSFLFEHLHTLREDKIMPNGFYSSYGKDSADAAPFIFMARNKETGDVVPVQVDVALHVYGHEKDTFAIQLLYGIPTEELAKAPWLAEDRSSIAMPLRGVLWDLARQAKVHYQLLSHADYQLLFEGVQPVEGEIEKRVLSDEAHFNDASCGVAGMCQMQCPVRAFEQFQKAAFDLDSRPDLHR